MQTDKTRVFGLDLLRALAVLFVVYAHAYIFIKDYAWAPYYFYLPIFDGVSIFFVLSGYLIGRILIKIVVADKISGLMLRDFWFRRWFRTLPNYFFILTLLIAIYYFSGRPLPENLASYFIFSQNLNAPHPDFFPEAWSLAVEEWFYLCIPIPLYGLKNFSQARRRRLLLLWLVAVLVGVTAFRLERAYTQGFTDVVTWDLTLRKQVLMRFDALMYGVLGAYLHLFYPDQWNKRANKTFLLGIILLLVDKLLINAPALANTYLNYFNLTVAPLATLLLLPKLSNWRRRPDAFSKAVTFISLISYSMYLLNLSLIQVLLMPWYELACAACTASGLLQYVSYWAITILLSYLLYQYFEEPVMKLRDRFRIQNRASVSPFQ